MTNDKSNSMNHSVAATGLRCTDARGTQWLDGMAGRVSPWGHGFAGATEAIQGAAPSRFSMVEATAGSHESAALGSLRERLQGAGLRSLEAMVVTPSSDAAIELAVLAARRWGVQGSVASGRFRTIGLVGSDHGRSALCRTLSGRPELHRNLGPMMAGFAHIAIGDLDALKRSVDEQSVAVIVSPLAIHDAGKLLDADFLRQIRRVCDETGALLIADESRVPFGSCGAWLTTPTIADIELDAVVLSAGLFAGLSGAILVGFHELAAMTEYPSPGHPLLEAVLEATLASLRDDDGLAAAMETHRGLAVELAERLSEFEFIQDIHANGANLGIELDGPARELIESAAREHLWLESAGEHAVWMQLPMVMAKSDRDELLSKFVTAIQTTGRMATMASI